jgi:hypothetical protein
LHLPAQVQEQEQVQVQVQVQERLLAQALVWARGPGWLQVSRQL